MRVAVLADAAEDAHALGRMLVPPHSLLWLAGNRLEVLRRCQDEPPDLLLLPVNTPDSIDLTRCIMAASPCAILLFSFGEAPATERVFAAMGHGALDVVHLPGRGIKEAQALLRKLQNLAWIIGLPDDGVRTVRRAEGGGRPPLVAIGASAGGPATLSVLLRDLPAGFGGAIVLIQHLDDRFTAGMADWLSRETPLPVRLARPGEAPQPGVVLLAGRNDHLCLRADGTLAYSAAPSAQIYHPSIDVCFASIAQHWRGRAVGVLLTGMGRDGADGLKAMRGRGFTTIAQDQASSAVYGMPKAAAAIGAAAEVLPLSRIAPRLVELCM